MMYDYKLLLVIRTPRACPWEQSGPFQVRPDRLYKLRNGTEVQRDWYSSFLLYCYNDRTNSIDKNKCNMEFGRFYNMEKKLIERIKVNKIKVLNSGIKVG